MGLASGKHSNDTEAARCREAEETPFHQQLRNICNNKDRRSKKQAELKTDFLELFDVAHGECDQIIRIARGVEFLQDQRSKRNMFISGEDSEREETTKAKIQRDETTKVCLQGI